MPGTFQQESSQILFNMLKSKVYLVDYEIISPLGLGKESVWKSIENNSTVKTEISRFNSIGLSDAAAAEVGEVSHLIKDEEASLLNSLQYDRKFELTVATYHKMKDRLLAITNKVEKERCGVIFGLGIDVTPFEKLEDQLLSIVDLEGNPAYNLAEKINPKNGQINTLFNPLDISAIYLAEKMGLAAFQKTTLTACAASTQAISSACSAIQRGEADLVISGGSDSIVNQLAFMAFSKLGILAPVGENGIECKPFDSMRNGTLAGEASGICVLVSEKLLEELQLKPLFEVIGFGNSLDAYKITAPDPEGLGMQKAIRDAVNMAQINAKDIDYINLHGTGTIPNDPIELAALKAVFGEDVNSIPMSSTKDRHGHAIAAAGIQELAILCLALENNCIPSNLNLKRSINTNMDLVQKENRNQNLNIGMTNNFAFGGVNSSIILKKISQK